MTTQNKAGCLLLLTLALLIFQTDLYGEENKPVQSLPVYRLDISFDLKNNLLKGTAAITLPDAGDTTVSTGHIQDQVCHLERIACTIQDQRRPVQDSR